MPHAMRSQAPKLLDDVRTVLRLHHSFIHTERSYIDLTDLAVHGSLAPATQNRAMHVMDATAQAVAKLLYGSGLRIIEAVRLRGKDIDYQMEQLTVRAGVV